MFFLKKILELEWDRYREASWASRVTPVVIVGHGKITHTSRILSVVYPTVSNCPSVLIDEHLNSFVIVTMRSRQVTVSNDMVPRFGLCRVKGKENKLQFLSLRVEVALGVKRVALRR